MAGGSRLSGFASWYLDCLRFGAALVVALAHFAWGPISGGLLWQLVPFAHAAVVVFFVMSGVVIGQVTDARGQGWRDYAAARLSRLYSVMLPALAVTILVEIVLSLVVPQIAVARDGLLPGIQTPLETPVLQVLAGLLFLNSVWYLNIAVLTDSPFWSLPYEAFYYLAWGVYCFAPRRWRWIGIGVVAAVAGPNIVLLAPVWLCGVAAWRLGGVLSARWGWAVAAVGLAGVVAVLTADTSEVCRLADPRYRPLQYCFTDQVLGVGLGLHLAGMLALRLPAPPPILVDAARRLAGCTFALYLVHLPVLILMTGILPGTADRDWRLLAILAAVAGVTTATAWVAEPLRRRLRGFLLAGVPRSRDAPP